MEEQWCMKCLLGIEHCQGITSWCKCRCGQYSNSAYTGTITAEQVKRGTIGSSEIAGVRTRQEEVAIIAKAIEDINRFKENLMPNENYMTTTSEPGPYRCLAYKPEVGAEVKEEIMIADSAEQAQNLFAASVGLDAIKEGTVIKVFPMR